MDSSFAVLGLPLALVLGIRPAQEYRAAWKRMRPLIDGVIAELILAVGKFPVSLPRP